MTMETTNKVLLREYTVQCDWNRFGTVQTLCASSI